MTEKAGVHPSFKRKEVYFLECRNCASTICRRAMQSVLIADTNTELYSTDVAENRYVSVTGERFYTDMCHCQLEKIACTECGNVIGYHVRLPCRSCLHSCNNGHMWMFYTEQIAAYERLTKDGNDILLWGDIPGASSDHAFDFLQEECLR